MKLQLAKDSQMSFEAAIYVDDHDRLDEFAASRSADNTSHCYVAVANGQTLRIVCKIASLLKGSVIDLSVDGILRDTYHHKFDTVRNFEYVFDTGIYQQQRSLRRGKLTVNSAVQDKIYNDGKGCVGTIEVRLYRMQTAKKETCLRETLSPIEIVDYKDINIPWNSFGVLPDCEIVFDGDDLMSQSKRASFKRQFNALRPGEKPWALMRFIYRFEDSLKAANFMPHSAKASTATSSLIETPRLEFEGDDYIKNMVSEAGHEATEGMFRGKKRTFDEVENLVDHIAFGTPYCTTGLHPGQILDDFGQPVKRTKQDMDDLMKSVDELTKLAKNSREKAQESRDLLVDRVRAQTGEERLWEDLMRKKEMYLKEIEHNNRAYECYQAKLNGQEDLN